jgi:hypothetical protein
MLNLLVAVALFAAACIGALSFWGASESGKAASQTFVAKDLTADILPPPLYLIEMRLVLSQTIEGSMPLDQAQSEFKRLKGEYEDRIKFWKEHPPYGLEAKLMGTQHQEGHSRIPCHASRQRHFGRKLHRRVNSVTKTPSLWQNLPQYQHQRRATLRLPRLADHQRAVMMTGKPFELKA